MKQYLLFIACLLLMLIPVSAFAAKVTKVVITAEEPVVEVIPEVVVTEAETSIEETSETEVSTADEETGDPAEEAAEDVRAEKPELSMSMKKEELLEASRERGVQISSRATKAAIIEAIEKADNETEQ